MYMKLTTLRDATTESTQLFEDSIRDSRLLSFKNVQLTGRSVHYPNCLLYSGGQLIHPYDERVMSLQRESFYENDEWAMEVPSCKDSVETPVFFFHYNVDNYYHFLYDSLPYLYAFKGLKKNIPSLQALIQTSHPTKKDLPPFVVEFLRLLGIPYLFGKPNTLYKKLYISTSFTHGQQSNKPYSPYVASIWTQLVPSNHIQTPKRFYISRRSWIHGQLDNIGTNYTQRRKCVNEDAVVALLKRYDIEEVFTELLSTDEKIAYFRNAELVVGIVGGGMCNLLFSPPTTKALCINTPHFLDINYRFTYSMNHTRIVYSECTHHEETNARFPLYSRVRVPNGCIGEIELFQEGVYTVKLMKNDMAGFSQDVEYTQETFREDELVSLDPGLNSPFVCDMDVLENNLKSLIDPIL